MTDITIPPEAVEAAAKAIAKLRPNPYATNEEVARAAFIAGLKAWPGFWQHPYTKAVILPELQPPRMDRKAAVAERLFGDD